MDLRANSSRFANGERRAVVVALCSLLLASCTSTGAPDFGVANPNYAPTQAGAAAATTPGTSGVTTAGPALAATATTPQALMTTEGDTALPEQIAYLPTAKPGTPAFPLTAPTDAQTIAGNTPQQLVAPEQTQQQTATAAQQVAAGTTTVLPQQGTNSQRAAEPAAATQTASAATPEMNHPVYVTAGEMPAAPSKPEKKGFLASLFGASPAKAAPTAEKPKPIVPTEQAEAKQAIIPEDKPAKPIITLASAQSGQKQAMLASADSSAAFSNLPGVRKTALFEITRRSGTYDDSDVDLNEDDEGGAYQVASAAGLARLAPNGLLKQTESVDVACLKPSLVRVLKQIEGHYGKKMIVTSGYRDQARNVRARGAKNSLHMYCAAADIQVPGVSKWDLATYVRSLPGRGGVGTYCHTESVHVDVGPERDWNWRCRRRG
ncbi:YcbK family protein [Mesorhizobium retamae]|uniref:YcbK family protein n=1 Tax=Mesorhizobium retamae TaxID=2912854 RepID=UPI003CCFF098